MIKLLASLFALLNKAFSFWHDRHLEDQGRQQSIKEMNDAINRQIELGENAVSTPDPVRDERLRSRFDRSRSGQ